jgi:hypothetical protein
MRALIAATIMMFSMASASVAGPGDLMDEKTHEWTDRGIVANLIAAAEVSELRCGLKGQIDAAVRVVRQAGKQFDLNDKSDFSDVTFLATEIMTKAKKDGFEKWCKSYREGIAKVFAQ